jgi:DNA transposition AAA+ family ATPase
MSEPPSAAAEHTPRRLAGFQVTRQHRRFVEFADAVRRHRYIGACYGAPGLGKTLSARTYAAADDYDRWYSHRYHQDAVIPASLVQSRTVMYTPYLTITARQLDLEVGFHVHHLSVDVQRVLNPETAPDFDLPVDESCHTELVIIDEADRLKTTGLEQLRDFFDRRDLGLILIGMPGFDRQLARYPQLYSRIGFAHHYQPLDPEDIPAVLAHYWERIGLPFDHTPGNEAAASAITRITGGNFRLIERLMSQIARILDINQLDDITTDVVQAARQTLVVGSQ